jgi:hypothetical protein
MKKKLCTAVAGLGLLAALGSPGPATAATTAPVNAAAVIQQLQANGYRVILNKVGSAPLSLSHVTAIRPGTPVTETVPAGGGDTEQKVLYTPVYVDVAP